MADTKPCTFCTLPPERIIDSNEYGVVIRDAYPITQGHTLVIPKRHMSSWFDATQAEQLALFSLLNTAKEHLTPRYHSDLTDPRGGVRWITPEKAKYWA
jgi:diadenosine tetraphosphate (Ap4A) HIT family hydrolase